MTLDDPNASASSSYARGGLQERLAVYSRYAAIVQEQFRALQEEDLPQFSELADRRAEIQEAIGEGPDDFSEETSLNSQEEELLHEVREEMGNAITLDREMQAQLLRLRARAATEIKSISQREGKVKRYMAEDGAPAQDRRRRLNVRL